MEINHDKYLNGLKIRMHSGMIKVITGICRCGKTYLVFDLFRKHLIESGITPGQIIEVALDDEDNERLRDPKELSSYVCSKIKDDSTPYQVLLDEVQYATSDEELKGSRTSPALRGLERTSRQAKRRHLRHRIKLQAPLHGRDDRVQG